MKIKSQKGISQRFSGVLGGPLGEKFSSRRLSVLLPLIVLPLNLSTENHAPLATGGQAEQRTMTWCKVASDILQDVEVLFP